MPNAQDNLRLSANDISARTNLAFKIADGVAQKKLPTGWELNSPAAGPTKGFNLSVTLIDYLMADGPDGKPIPSNTTFVLSVPAKRTATGEAATMVFGGFTPSAAVPGAYGVFGPAELTVDRRSLARPDGTSLITEAWAAKAADGSALDIAVEFTRGAPARVKAEAKIYSAKTPDFFCVYRFEQAADVARSTAMGIDRVAKFSFKATGPTLAALFDGSERLIAITSVPSYVRSVYLAAG